MQKLISKYHLLIIADYYKRQRIIKSQSGQFILSFADNLLTADRSVLVNI